MKTINLLNEQELHFDDDTAAAWAVAYGYCSENNKMSWLFTQCNNNNMENAYKELPIVQGKKTISCGNWAAYLN